MAAKANKASRGKLTKASSLSILQRMLVMRRFEERVFDLHAAGHMRGVFHLYIGQEGTGAAALEAAMPEDLILSTHRNHGHVVGRGADIGRTYAEFTGRTTGLLGGRGGTFHASDPSLGMLQTSAIVGGCISLAVGAAYGIKHGGTKPSRAKRVAIAFFGDAALEEGVSYESLNLAALWKLPVIFVCENNSIGLTQLKGDRYPRSLLAAERLSRVPEMVGIRTIQISNGANAAEVFAATQDARRHCIAGKGPVFIESPIVRWPGGQALFPKSLGATDLSVAFGMRAAPGPHREWKEKHDPLIRFAREVIKAKHASRDDILAMDKAVLVRVEAGVQFALESPYPDPSSATERIFA